MKRPSEAVVDAWIALMRAQQVAFAKIEQSLRDAKLPSHAWYDLLWELERAGDEGLRPFELQRRMLIAQPNISRLIDRLAAVGLVERRPSAVDRRGQDVVITASGRAMRKSMWPVYAAAINDAVGRHLSHVEAEVVARVLSRIGHSDG